MKRKISQSIQAKTFLSMLALLVVCCILIYGMVMIFLPRNYHTELEGQVTSAVPQGFSGRRTPD